MVFAVSRPALQIKAPVRFPARVLAAAGVAVSKLNGVFSFGLDFPSLVDNAGIADPSQFTTVAYNKVLGRYEEVRLDYLPVPTEAANRTPRGDAAYSILNTDRYVALTAALTSPRAWTLPAANSVPAGRLLVIQDEVGGLSGTNPITLTPTGADTINGAASFVLATARSGVEFRSDGTSKWSTRVLADASVTTSKLADANVTNAKLADGAVTTAKLADGSVLIVKGGTGATTAFGARQALGTRGAGISAKTAAYPVVVADAGKLLTVSGTFNVTLPPAATAGNGFVIELQNIAASTTTTVVPNTSETINGAASLAIGPGQSGALLCDGATWRAIGFAPFITAQSLGANGYRKWSDGSIDQWGFVGGNGSSDTAVTFPAPFQTAIWSLTATVIGATNSISTAEVVSTSTPTLTGFTGYPRFMSNGGSVGRAGEPWSWQARGN